MKDIVSALRELACGKHNDLSVAVGAADEIERLRAALTYEENRFKREITHGPGCYEWGPRHYECALREIKRLQVEIARLTEERQS